MNMNECLVITTSNKSIVWKCCHCGEELKQDKAARLATAIELMKGFKKAHTRCEAEWRSKRIAASFNNALKKRGL